MNESNLRVVVAPRGNSGSVLRINRSDSLSTVVSLSRGRRVVDALTVAESEGRDAVAGSRPRAVLYSGIDSASESTSAAYADDGSDGPAEIIENNQ